MFVAIWYNLRTMDLILVSFQTREKLLLVIEISSMNVLSLALLICRCKTCGEYIYKGKKFNARKETVQNELYMGLPIFRFYIKCTRCLAEITFKVSAQ